MDWLDWLRLVGLDTVGRLVTAGAVVGAYVLGRHLGAREPLAWRAYGGVVVAVAVVWLFLAAGGPSGSTEEGPAVDVPTLEERYRSATAAALALLAGGWIGVRRAQGPLQIQALFRRAHPEQAQSPIADLREGAMERTPPVHTPTETGWFVSGHRIVKAARQARHAEAAAGGARWLVEGHDMWDFQRGDDDLGVCFRTFNRDAEVDAFVAESLPDQSYKLAGIYDVRRPLDGQGPGISPERWQAGHRDPDPMRPSAR